MKDAKTITEFVKSLFANYSLCYSAYFYDYNENDERIPAPLFEDDVVIYTGYKEEEILDKINVLKSYEPIIIKFGRYVPNQKSHYDDVLGVNLASDNQYAKIIK